MRQLRKSEIRKLNEQIRKTYGELFEISPKAKATSTEIEEKGRKNEVIAIDGVPSFFIWENRIFPTLKLLVQNNPLKKIVVDMGAVKFIANGADIMRPGVVKCDEGIKEGQPVAVVDETHQKPLALGQSMFSSEELMKQKTGKVVRTLHFAGDRIWNSE